MLEPYFRVGRFAGKIPSTVRDNSGLKLFLIMLRNQGLAVPIQMAEREEARDIIQALNYATVTILSRDDSGV